MKFNVTRRQLPFALFGSAAAAWQAQAADAVTDFYKGKTLTLIVSSAADGGYDRLARTVAKHMFAYDILLNLARAAANRGGKAIEVRPMPIAIIDGIFVTNIIARARALKLQ